MGLLHWPNVCAAVVQSTAGLDLREPISRLSGFPKCVHKRVKRLLTSGGSSLSIPETILLVYSSPSNLLVLRHRGLKHM
jgi:hypothetical protein